MSKLRSPINYKNVELELLQALSADKLYKLQNDAKLRAIEQNVPTYEDFRQLVNAAHLKPLKCDDVKSKIKRCWNPIVHIDNSNVVMPFEKQEMQQQQSEDRLKLWSKSDNISANEIPTTYVKFIQVWKTIKGHKEKFHYLKMSRYTLREKIFCTEISPSLFVEIIDICFRNISIADNIEFIVDILCTLSKCNRFHLTVSFMGQNEKEMCTQLFRNLLINAVYQDEIFKDTIKSLALLYEVVLE
ncbi:dynein axonemal assembly factor 19 [Bombus vancouverensis nearcticus]|nr:coiled-coil domain-containing protein 103 isoform X2 [Bombus vancouverensis nearcticus]